MEGGKGGKEAAWTSASPELRRCHCASCMRGSANTAPSEETPLLAFARMRSPPSARRCVRARSQLHVYRAHSWSQLRGRRTQRAKFFSGNLPPRRRLPETRRPICLRVPVRTPFKSSGGSVPTSGQPLPCLPPPPATPGSSAMVTGVYVHQQRRSCAQMRARRGESLSHICSSGAMEGARWGRR